MKVKEILCGLLLMAVLSGCTSNIRVQYPLKNFSYKPQAVNIANQNFNLPEQIPCVLESDSKAFVYHAKNGKRSITEDNVTVEVDSILSATAKDDCTVKANINGKEYSYSLFPMMVVLKVSNASDHIVTLERTIVRLEDGNKKEYQMINNINENKRKTKNKIQESLKNCINANKDNLTAAINAYKNDTNTTIENYKNRELSLSSLKEYIFTEYKEKFEDIMDIIKEKIGPPPYLRTYTLFVEHVPRDGWKGESLHTLLRSDDYWWSQYRYYPNSEMESYAAGRPFEDVYNPNIIFKMLSKKVKSQIEDEIKEANEIMTREIQKANEVINREMQTAEGAIRSAIQNIDDLPDTFPNMITSGVYQPINILPGRTESIVVPFSKHKDDEEIKKIFVHVFDLPTKVNEAGIPTKRANFHFEMVAEEAR